MEIVTSWLLKNLLPILLGIVSIGFGGTLIKTCIDSRDNRAAMVQLNERHAEAYNDLKEMCAVQIEQCDGACKIVVDGAREECRILLVAQKQIQKIYEDKPNADEEIKSKDVGTVITDINEWLNK